MASDRTAPKRHGFISEAGAPDAIMDCRTCRQPMAMDLLHALAAVDAGRLAGNHAIRFAEASHTTPDSAGGRLVAIECNRCNRERGAAEWITDAPTYRASGSLAMYRDTTARAKTSRGRLLAQGYIDG